MESNPEVQVIASKSAKAIVDQFLQTIPGELSSQLPQGFIEGACNDLQAEIYSCIDSRMRWTIQSAYAEISAQQREKLIAKSTSVLNYLPPEPLQKLPDKKQKPQHQAPKPTHEQIEVDNIDLTEETDFYTEVVEYYSKLKERFPNRQRRRRRCSAAAKHQESLLNVS